MIWWLVFVYALAGITVGRIVWEFDMFTDYPVSYEHAQDARARVLARRREVMVCWIVGAGWPVVPLWALWTHVRKPR